MSKFAQRLKKMQGSWEESEQQAKEMFTKVDAGVYLGQLQAISLDESGSGNLQIKRQHLIGEGEFDGVVVFDNLQLEASELSMAFARREIEAYGYACPEKLVDLVDVIDAIAEEAPEVKFRVTHSGEFTNVSVVESLSEDSEGGAEESGYTAEEIGAMNRTSLTEVVEASELKDIDVDELSLSEIRDAVLTGLGLVEVAEEVAEEETKSKATKATKVSKSTKTKKTKPEDDDGSDVTKGLQEFCSAQDIEFKPDDDDETLKGYIDEFEYPRDDLTEEEITLLESVGLECIKKGKK